MQSHLPSLQLPSEVYWAVQVLQEVAGCGLQRDGRWNPVGHTEPAAQAGKTEQSQPPRHMVNVKYKLSFKYTSYL